MQPEQSNIPPVTPSQPTPAEPVTTQPVLTPTPLVSAQPPIMPIQTAPQPTVPLTSMARSKYFIPTDIQDYKSVPLYRRRWFMIIVTLLVIPVGLIIVWSGKVYAQNQKTKIIYTFSNTQKVLYTIAGIIILLTNISRISS